MEKEMRMCLEWQSGGVAVHETVGYQTHGKVTGIVGKSKSEERSCWRQKGMIWEWNASEWTPYAARADRALQDDAPYVYGQGDTRSVRKE